MSAGRQHCNPKTAEPHAQADGFAARLALIVRYRLSSHCLVYSGYSASQARLARKRQRKTLWRIAKVDSPN